MSTADLMSRIDGARGGHQRAKDLFADARGKTEPEPAPPPENGGGISASDIGHAALDVAGFIPVVGAVADLANAAWYAAEGDYVNASLSAVSAVPGIGDAAAAAKLGVKGANAAADVAKATDVASDVNKNAGKAGDELFREGDPVPPMERTLDHALNPELFLKDVAGKYGINLRGSGQDIQVKFDETIPSGSGKLGRTLEAEGGRVVRVGPDALVDEATAANTIAHEVSHARDYLKGLRGDAHKPHGNSSSVADESAYGSGNALEEFIKGER